MEGDCAKESKIVLDKQRKFPEKLWEAASDESNDLVRWSEDGNFILVQAEDFKNKVLTIYPGLVQIASFSNFRRQLREYSFDWAISSEVNGLYKFSHPKFLKFRKDLLCEVHTRRKCNMLMTEALRVRKPFFGNTESTSQNVTLRPIRKRPALKKQEVQENISFVDDKRLPSPIELVATLASCQNILPVSPIATYPSCWFKSQIAGIPAPLLCPKPASRVPPRAGCVSPVQGLQNMVASFDGLNAYRMQPERSQAFQCCSPVYHLLPAESAAPLPLCNCFKNTHLFSASPFHASHHILGTENVPSKQELPSTVARAPRHQEDSPLVIRQDCESSETESDEEVPRKVIRCEPFDQRVPESRKNKIDNNPKEFADAHEAGGSVSVSTPNKLSISVTDSMARMSQNQPDIGRTSLAEADVISQNAFPILCFSTPKASSAFHPVVPGRVTPRSSPRLPCLQTGLPLDIFQPACSPISSPAAGVSVIADLHNNVNASLQSTSLLTPPSSYPIIHNLLQANMPGTPILGLRSNSAASTPILELSADSGPRFTPILNLRDSTPGLDQRDSPISPTHCQVESPTARVPLS